MSATPPTTGSRKGADVSTRAATSLEKIRNSGIIAIVRGDFEGSELVRIAQALLSNGIVAMEVTLNSAAAEKHIRLLQRELPTEALIGAGTVRTASDVGRALEAGAAFLVSPNLDSASVGLARQEDVLHLPGVMTPTEVQNAVALGALAVKLFPASTLGPAYLKTLAAPLDDVAFVPVGGIDPNSVGDYVRAGAVAVGAGSTLVSQDVGLDEISSRAARFSDAWLAATRKS
ncbi:MAG: bifunctional 4-hydroxy-2-oxoglutarate aldolase/2-dehydro-3-deoxy-phosphogluconate aldolase [Trueperaceae bacterium]